jgi:predicted DNA-binding transcriptional regulator AlpA
MKLLSYRNLVELGIGYSRTHLRRLMFDPKYAHIGFPRCVTLGTGRIGWIEDEILTWIRNRPRVELSALLEEEGA